MSKIGSIILAAGSSSRLGKPKQLLNHSGQSLIRRSIQVAQAITDMPLVVLGANYQEVSKEIRPLQIRDVFNLNWNKGMGNSIKFGIQEINRLQPDIDAVIIMVCDQPFAGPELLQQLVTAYRKGNKIVAASYRDTAGVPVLFDRTYFKELLKIDDQAGAKMLLRKYQVATVPFPQGYIDIDTPADWQNFSKNNGEN